MLPLKRACNLLKLFSGQTGPHLLKYFAYSFTLSSNILVVALLFGLTGCKYHHLLMYKTKKLKCVDLIIGNWKLSRM